MTSDREPERMLEGIRILDLSRVLAGPYATMLLADFGADVIKVEPPEGDETRGWLPPADESGRSTYFGSVGRGKRSVVLDLADPVDAERIRRLAAGADVVIDNFRPGVLERFGLDHSSLAAEAPGIVCCSITGFGPGAGAALPGYDLLVQAVGGLMSITGDEGGGPQKVGVAVVDVICGLHAVAGILLALRDRDRTGRGRRIEVDLMSSLLSALVNQAGSALATGVAPARLGTAHPSIAPYAAFRAADRELVIAVGNDRQFAALADALGAAGWTADPRFASNRDRVEHRRALTTELERVLATRPAADWVAMLSEARVPAGLIHDIPEAFELAAGWGLDPVAAVEGTRTVADPIRVDGRRPAPRTGPPGLGDHQDADWRPRPDPQEDR